MVSLPSEAEWEKAARGGQQVPVRAKWGSSPGVLALPGENGQMDNPFPERLYPWGDDPDPNRAHYFDTGIWATSAVGCFPGGASPYGVEDLSGNVWEWTRSLYRDYPYDPDDGREAARTEGPRVVRGGSFDGHQRGVRCAFRLRLSPDLRGNGVGFRVVVSPGSPA